MERKYTQEDIQNMINDYINNHLSQREVSEKYGIKRKYLYTILRKYGVDKDPGDYKNGRREEYKLQEEEIELLVKSGFKTKEIALILGLSENTVKYLRTKIKNRGNR